MLRFLLIAVLCAWPAVADHPLRFNIDEAVAAHGITAGGSSLTGSLSQNELAQLYNTFSFFNDVYNPIVFDLCYGPFESLCLPALYRNEAELLANWTLSRASCFETYCRCLPNGAVLPSTNGRVCSYSQPSQQEWCSVIGERCMPLRWQCYMSFIQSQLPSDCNSFLNCASSENVKSRNYLACLSEASLSFPGCEMSDACNLIAAPGQPHVTTGSASLPILSSSFITTTVVILCMLSLGVFFRICIRSQLAGARWRRLTGREGDDANAANLHPDIPLEQLPRRQIFFFGQLSNELLLDLSGGDQHLFCCSRCEQNIPTECLYGILMLLPCRCLVCLSCAATVPHDLSFTKDSVGGKGRLIPDHNNACPPCLVCQAPVRAALQFSDVFVVENEVHVDQPDHSSELVQVDSSSGAPSLPLSAAAPERKGQLSEELCPLCFDQPACVAFMPCGHMACCSSCARQLVAKTNASCHMCRSVIAYMTVLDRKTIAAIKMIRSRRATF